MVTGVKKSSKTIPVKKSKSKPSKGKTVLKVSKKIFSSKTKKRALTLSTETSESSIINDIVSKNTTSSQNKNSKAESKSVRSSKKPNITIKDTPTAKLKETNSDGKIKKRKLDKKTLAKRKLNKMKKMGFLTAPPRRSAALNASAIMNCIFDKPAAAAGPSAKLLNVKEELHDSEEEERTTSSDLEPDTSDKAENTGSNPKCDLSDHIEKGSDLPFAGRRMASLNASAMMQATFGREARKARRDPITIAIEASLREMKCKEDKEKKEQEKNITQISNSSTSNNLQPPGDKTNAGKTGEESKRNLNTSFSSSIEGLSESDIKMKLIESAKIKSKISRQSFEEKVKKKVRKSNTDKVDEKVSNKSRTGLIKSEASKQSDNVEKPIKLELIPGEEKTSRLENVTIEKLNKIGIGSKSKKNCKNSDICQIFITLPT